MHHVYAFLLSRHNFNVSLSPGELGQQSVDWVKEMFLEGSDYKDEWYTTVALITNDGQVLDLLPEDDILGLKVLLKDFRNLPPEKRLPKALEIAVQIAATDMGLYGCHQFDEKHEGNKKIAGSSGEALIDDIMVEIPRKLSSLYLEMERKARSAEDLIAIPLPAG